MKALLSVSDLMTMQDVVVLDARFRLQDPPAAERLFFEEHIPGAQRVDLDRDLSGPKRNPSQGRHPFPDREALAATLGRLGVGMFTPVVAYDDTDHGGAARLWALLRWLGHAEVAILDGGLRAWKEAGLPLEKGPGKVREPQQLPLLASLLSTRQIAELEGQPLFDLRAPERYRGDVEPLDPVAGHIPGAKNLPYASLLGPAGRFLPPEELAARLPPPGAVFYCGSGVTACVGVFAAHLVGREVSLYPGSWSAWSNTPGRPVAKGEE